MSRGGLGPFDGLWNEAGVGFEEESESVCHSNTRLEEPQVSWPNDREQVEVAFAEGTAPPLTKLAMDRIAKEQFELGGLAPFFRKSELVEFFKNPDLRPTLMAAAGTRQRRTYDAQKARREAIANGLERRFGKWRFAAIARVPPRRFIDEISGLEVVGGLVLRDTRIRDTLVVGYSTAAEMKRRRRLTWYDKDRLPVAADEEAIAEVINSREAEIDEILDTISTAAVPPSAAVTNEVNEILQSLWPDES